MTLTELGEMLDAQVYIAASRSICTVKGCRRVGKVKVFYGSKAFPNQQAQFVCSPHACDITNEFISAVRG